MDSDRITNFIMPFVFLGTVLAYIFYFRQLHDLGEFIIAVAPAFAFILGGMLIFRRDRKQIARARQKDEYTRTTELNWGQALRHDCITYFVPILILIIPFFTYRTPNIGDVLQAISAFIAFSYLKLSYWGEF